MDLNDLDLDALNDLDLASLDELNLQTAKSWFKAFECGSGNSRITAQTTNRRVDYLIEEVAI